VGRDIAVGIATRSGLDSPRSSPGGGEIFPHPSRSALGPAQPHAQWVQGTFSGVKRPRRGADYSLQLVPRLKKEYSYTISLLGVRVLFYGE